jgi:hypothetical protein
MGRGLFHAADTTLVLSTSGYHDLTGQSHIHGLHQSDLQFLSINQSQQLQQILYLRLKLTKRCFEKHCFCLSSSCVCWCPTYITVLCFLFCLSCIHYVASFSGLSILDCHFGFSNVYIVYEINGICSFSNFTREIKGLFKSYTTLEANEFIFINFHVLTYIFRQSKIDMCTI